jgi:Plasmid pRiA4b ORF-3-like protein
MARQLSNESINADTYALHLTVPDRQLILTSRHFGGTDYVDRIRKSPEKQPLEFSVDDWEDLYDRLVEEAQETDDRKRERKLGKLLGKIGQMLDEFDDDEFEDDIPFGLGDDVFGETNTAEMLSDFFTSVGQNESGAPVCVVQLTEAQREILADMNTISDDMREMLRADAPDGAYSLNLRQTLVLGLAVAESLNSNASEKATHLVDVSDRLSEGLVEAMRQEAVGTGRPRGGHGASTPLAVAYQLKITLEHSKPPIWRRIKVADCTLDELHDLIQLAMGWHDCHMHSFQVGDTYYGNAEVDDPEAIDEACVLLSSLVNAGQEKIRYWYDFGDDWWHTIKVEKVSDLDPKERLPICLKGARACPPEDVGGVWGYESFLATLQDPKDENHQDLMEWSGGSFDPEAFDLNDVNARLAGS